MGVLEPASDLLWRPVLMKFRYYYPAKCASLGQLTRFWPFTPLPRSLLCLYGAYVSIPPFRVISRDIVEAGLVSSRAMLVIVSPLARPRLIVSRSSILKCLHERCRCTGVYPPDCIKTCRIPPGVLLNDRAISLCEKPERHIRKSSFCWLYVNCDWPI